MPADTRAIEPDEELWFEIFEGIVRGGVLPMAARDKVALGSGRGAAFADAIYARWGAQMHALREAALKQSA